MDTENYDDDSNDNNEFSTLLTTGCRDNSQPFSFYQVPKINIDKEKLSWTTETEFLIIINNYEADISHKCDQIKHPHVAYTKSQPDKEPFNAIDKGGYHSNLLKFIYQFYHVLPQNIVIIDKLSNIGIIENIDNIYGDRQLGFRNFSSIVSESIYPQIQKMIHSGWWTETMSTWFGNIENYGNFTYNKTHNSHFVVSRERIHSLPRKFYNNMYNWIVNNSLDEKDDDMNIKEVDHVWTSNFYIGCYLEWTWELIFASYKEAENKKYKVESRTILALFGVRSYWLDVTEKLIKLSYSDGKIIIPVDFNMNSIFGDPYYGMVKYLKIIIDNKTHQISENRMYDVVIII